MNRVAARRGLFATAAVVWLLACWLRANPTGELSHHYTDHLRHMGESVALVARGFEVYREPYEKATAGLKLPCSLHAGLWASQPAPYPPLGILLHWPWAAMESAGWLSPPTSHRIVGLVWVLVSLLGCAAAWSLFRGQSWVAWLGYGLLLVPLWLGIGANAFFDVAFLAAGALGLSLAKSQRWSEALVLIALAGALHFRALSLGCAGLWVLRHLWRASSSRRWVAVAAAVAVAPSAASAFALRTAGAFRADNPVHFSHWMGPRFLGFVVIALAASAYLVCRGQRWTAATVLCCSALFLTDPIHGWWHAAILTVPALVLAATARPKSTSDAQWAVLWGWAFVAGALAFRHPFTAFWQWIDFALHGVR